MVCFWFLLLPDRSSHGKDRTICRPPVLPFFYLRASCWRGGVRHFLHAINPQLRNLLVCVRIHIFIFITNLKHFRSSVFVIDYLHAKLHFLFHSKCEIFSKFHICNCLFACEFALSFFVPNLKPFSNFHSCNCLFAKEYTLLPKTGPFVTDSLYLHASSLWCRTAYSVITSIFLCFYFNPFHPLLTHILSFPLIIPCIQEIISSPQQLLNKGGGAKRTQHKL